jgi:hypothetical protein
MQLFSCSLEAVFVLSLSDDDIRLQLSRVGVCDFSSSIDNKVLRMAVETFGEFRISLQGGIRVTFVEGFPRKSANFGNFPDAEVKMEPVFAGCSRN